MILVFVTFCCIIVVLEAIPAREGKFVYFWNTTMKFQLLLDKKDLKA